jgi:hypothetical protein
VKRGRRGAILVAFLAAAGACRSEESGGNVIAAPPTGPAPVASASAPIDHLAPDELVEGDKKAFGVTLPRDVKVDGAFADLVLASAHLPVHPLAKYFRARLTDGSMHEGEESASFEHVRVPGNTASEYGVRVYLSSGFTRIEMRDTTPKPVPDLPNDEARWKQAGLTPQGKILDPTHLE